MIKRYLWLDKAEAQQYVKLATFQTKRDITKFDNKTLGTVKETSGCWSFATANPPVLFQISVVQYC